MKIVLYGGTGMVGQGVLLECLRDPGVEKVLAVGRRPLPTKHPKVEELVLKDLTEYSGVEAQLAGYDACFYCLGISSLGMSEQDYRHVTYDLALAAANALVKRNPNMTFVFVSGASTNGTGEGKVMWARVKGQTENAIAKLPFKAVYSFRPAFIHSPDGVVSKTLLYRALYAVLRGLYPLLKRLFPRFVSTTGQIGQAMLRAVRVGAPKSVLEVPDINALAAGVSLR